MPVKIKEILNELRLSPDEFNAALKEAEVTLAPGARNLSDKDAEKVRVAVAELRRREEKKKEVITLPSQMTVKEFAAALSLPVPLVIQKLMENGVMATINEVIDYETAAIIAADLGYTVKEDTAQLEAGVLTPEKLALLLAKENPALQEPRPPVVAVMGHVDAGKTSILDAIRKTKVAAQEAGGITQSISSYQVRRRGKIITFIDTPGHEAFEFMRKRGASLADIAILVVAADSGVQSQTKEAIAHARAAKIPIVVAINKIDLPKANVAKVKKQLAEEGLVPEEWGGKTVMVETSARHKVGLDDLLDVILVVAEELKPAAQKNRPALGSVIEARRDPHLGPVAAVLVHTGTLKINEHVTVGRAAGTVRRLLDFNGHRITEALPGQPAMVIGLDQVPEAGDILQVVPERKQARVKAKTISAVRAKKEHEEKVETEPSAQLFPLVLKTDVQGSLEAAKAILEAMSTPEIQVQFLKADVGAVSDSDIATAGAAAGIVYAFKAKVLPSAQKLAKEEGVTIKAFDVIYALAEDVRRELEKRLPEEVVRKEVGKMEVIKVFFTIKGKQIVGGKITAGMVREGALVVAERQGKEVARGKVTEVQREKIRVKQVRQGKTCGLTVEGKGKIKEGDLLTFFTEKRVKKKIPASSTTA
jgi:translation initiation factor IF-2